jgi:hypothetical protein
MNYKSHRILFIFVLFIIFMLHVTYLPNGFTWLDHRDIESKRAIIPLTQASQMFVIPFGQTGFYRPLVTLFHSVDYTIYGFFAPGYHLTNVLLHTLVAGAAVLFLSVFFTLSFFEIMLVMLIIGLHPLGWLPAGSISYRPELLVTLFIFFTVFFHAKARMTRHPLFAVLAVLCFGCALLSKETALVLIPLLILLWEVLWKTAAVKNKKKMTGSPWLTLYIPELIVFGLYCVLRFQAVPQVWNVQQYPLSLQEAIGTRIYTVGKLLTHFIIPFKPPLSDAVPIIGLFTIYTVLFLLLVAGCTFYIIRKGLREPWSKALLLFFILLLPAFGFIPVPRLGSPHYGYIPIAGFVVIIILFLRQFHKKSLSWQRTIIGVFTLWMIVMACTTVISGMQFKNDQILFAPEIAKDKHFYEGYFYLGNYYVLHNDYTEAETAYKNAFVKHPQILAYHERTASIINLALLKHKQAKTDEAIVLLEEALRHGDAAYKGNINALLMYFKSQLHKKT